MKIAPVLLPGMLTFLFTSMSAQAVDRVHAGQWETVLTTKAGNSSPATISCLTASEAAFLNGDAAALRKHVEESMAKNTRGRCKVTDLQVKGNAIAVTTACGSNHSVVTTTYHGETYEAVSTAGTTIRGRRLGACP